VLIDVLSPKKINFVSIISTIISHVMSSTDFDKFARLEKRINSTTLWDYQSAVNAYVNPTIIEERPLNVAQMDVFSRLMMDRIIFLGVGINDDVANIITAQLLFLASVDPSADISLYINSPGGQVSSGLAIYDTMQLVEPDVATICTGMAASMGSVLLCAGKKGKRSCLPHSRVLIHQPLGGAQGQASDILIAAKEIEKTRNELISIISQHSGTPYEKVFADADRDFWMTAEEAKSYGMVDDILTKRER
jgi:ATP-dependent Clp protease protease subunit